jgi:hypothetical protein
MPRGSKPGERRGGRQRGTPNKKTALRNAALAAAASDPDISPLDYLLGIVRDANESSERRITAAKATLRFVHVKPGSVRPGNPGGTAIRRPGRSGAKLCDLPRYGCGADEARRDAAGSETVCRLPRFRRGSCNLPQMGLDRTSELMWRLKDGASAACWNDPASAGRRGSRNVVPRSSGGLIRSCRKVLAVYRPERLGLLELMQRVRERIDKGWRNALLAENDVHIVFLQAAGQQRLDFSV